MTWQKATRLLHVLVGLSASFALIALGVFLLSITSQAKKTLIGVDSAVIQMAKDADDLKVMTNATLFQIGDVSHAAADMIRYEKRYVTQESSQLIITGEKLNSTLDQLQTTMKSIDSSQKSVVESTKVAIDTIPGVTNQLQSTLIQTQSTLVKTGATIETLNQLVARTQPAIEHIDDATGHLNNMTAALDQVVQNATKPKPWYRKVLGYLWAPIQLAATFAK